MPIKEIIQMRVKRLYPKSKIPTRGSDYAAGYDLYAENVLFDDDSDNTPHTAKIRDYLDAITLSSQSTDECINCPVSVGCGWCSAYNYESTGDVNKRVTHICWAHKGRVLASCYYHNKRYLELGDTAPKAVLLPDKDALQIISRDELEYLHRLQEEAEAKYLKEQEERYGI